MKIVIDISEDNLRLCPEYYQGDLVISQILHAVKHGDRVREGHWIDYQDGKWIYAKCSECETIHDYKSDYCPKCGCFMGIQTRGGLNMQIVINVDNELYEYFSKRRTMHDNGYFSHIGKLIKALRNGIILPKGHGDLIDRGELKTHFIGTEQGTDLEVYLESTIIDAKAIIEADKEN